MHSLKFISLLAALLLLGGCGEAGKQTADNGKPALDSPTVASVNGEPVPEALLDAYLRARGAANASPQQRQAALQEVVNLVLLRQQAEKQGLDENPEVLADLLLHRLSTLATRQVRQHNAEDPITDEDARAEYDRNRDAAGTKEYHVRHILLGNKRTAQETIVELNKGADFADLADERSMDNREDAGGDLGWLDLTQLPEALREPVRNLRAGAHSQEPVQTRFGWHVLKLDETRQLEAPGFDEVKQGVKASLQRQRMESYIQGLRAEADIKVTEEFAQSPAPGPGTGAEPQEQEDTSGN